MTIAAQRDPAKWHAPESRRGSAFFGRGIDQGGETSSRGAHLPLSLCTVPSPVSFAVLMMPVPLASSWRARSSLSASAPRPAKSFPNLAGFAHKLAVALDLGLDDAQAGPDALADHRALELGEPVIWNSSLPAGVLVSIDCWSR
jgi:hypothetical protein